jgi:hypothetical protein
VRAGALRRAALPFWGSGRHYAIGRARHKAYACNRPAGRTGMRLLNNIVRGLTDNSPEVYG